MVKVMKVIMVIMLGILVVELVVVKNMKKEWN